jgi:integrase
VPKKPRINVKDLLGARGFGHAYKPTYTDKKTGERKESAFWWVTYSHEGKRRYVSSKSKKKKNAEDLLKQIFTDIWQGRLPWVGRNEPTLDQILKLVETHYANQKLKTASRLPLLTKRMKAFPFFEKGAVRARKITEARIEEYTAWRLKSPKGNAPGTINLELSMLGQAFRIAVNRLDEDGRPMLERMPKIAMLKVPPARQRFPEQHEFQALHAALLAGDKRSSPGDLADLATFYHLTGWRNAEPRSLSWSQVNWFRNTLTLEARFAKNGQPLEYPFGADPDLEALLRKRRKATDEAERELGKPVPWIFHRAGQPIRSFWQAWRKACVSIGLPATGPRSLRPHDFRRARARDLMDATADPFLTCELVGWRDLDSLARYRIVNTEDREGALAKAQALRQTRQAALAGVEKIDDRKKG